ncbi:cation diffusion facilitator family transporter [Saccharibacillus sp. CPCC 101409]|uniref:cation diffusion facilitator family transporter n=1 Tax=Saccharibacillus sp. CPCC 101409 TaxID=3058041 RepID=UPI0026726351|nr:cation diffusion facilitator family transporter [Saccharibacillus sp. CPCC 101409]MDO3412601.1 cation diffusion facilitator family transporter [Saccharibacillus sp. CPCC 101409]
MVDVYEKIKEGERGAWVSIFAYLILSALKLTIGYLFLSSALQADGLNNLTDIVASVAVLIGLRISRKPPDGDHAYGHFRAETVAALIASVIMALVGVQVLVDAGRTLTAGKEESPEAWVAAVALFCAAAMYGVYRYNLALSKQTGSQALMAASKDNLSDALVSIGAAVGILGSQLGMPWLDVVAAFVVGLIICKTAWEILSDSLHRLTDGFDEKELAGIRQTIGAVAGVEEVRDLKARVNGSQTVIDVIVEVPRDLSLIEGHDIADRIEAELKEKHEIYFVGVHVEPKE